MAEYGIVAPKGRNGFRKLIDVLAEEADERVPEVARTCFQMLVVQFQVVNTQALETERRIKATARSTEFGPD